MLFTSVLRSFASGWRLPGPGGGFFEEEKPYIFSEPVCIRYLNLAARLPFSCLTRRLLGLLLLLPGLAAAGTPVLRLEATVAAGAGVNATAFVDQVELINIATGAVVTSAVPNASFETPPRSPGGVP